MRAASHEREARVQRGIWMCAMGGCEAELRSRRCKECGAVFWICRRCDRGHQYGSRACRDEARRRTHRQAQRRYQQCPIGRFKHAINQKMYRSGVTDQGSQGRGSSANLPSTSREGSPWEVSCQERTRTSTGTCVICGKGGRWFDPHHEPGVRRARRRTAGRYGTCGFTLHIRALRVYSQDSAGLVDRES